MDESLRKIVDIDDALRARIRLAQAELDRLQTQHQDADTALKMAEERAQQKADTILQQAQAKDEQAQKAEEAHFAAAAEKMRALFAAKQDAWAEELAQRCREAQK